MSEQPALEYVCRLCGYEWQTVTGLMGHLRCHTVEPATYGTLVQAEQSCSTLQAELTRLRQERDALRAALAALFAYTTKLEGASSAWFVSRSYARRPDVAPDLGDRVRVLLAPARSEDGGGPKDGEGES